MQRDIQYSYSSDVEFNSISSAKFTESTFDNPQKSYLDSPQATLNLGPAYNMRTIIAKQSCLKCDPALLTQIQVNGKPYFDPTSTSSPVNDEMYSIVEPFSGILMEQRSALSYFIYLNGDYALPFP